MDSSSIDKIRGLITNSRDISVAVGANPSLDSMASALSLYLSLRDEKEISVVSPSEPTVEISSLVGIDKVKRQTNSQGGDLTVSFPYQEGEIEKVSYTLEGGYLNIVVKGGENGLSFSEKDVEFRKSTEFLPELLFVIGTPKLSDLGEIFDVGKLKETKIINIDNSSENQSYGDIVMVSQRLSSVSEAVTNLMVSLGLKIDLDIAQNLLSGIVSSTDNFQSEKTSYLAFQMASYLMQQGAVRPKLGERQEFRDFEDLTFGPRQTPPNEDTFPRVQPQRGEEKKPEEQQAGFQPRPQKQNLRQGPQQNWQPRPSSPQRTKKKQEKAPKDWLEPKVYKGSTIV